MTPGSALPRALATLALAALLASCSGSDEDPTELPTLAAPTATASPTAPAIPAEAQPRTRAGAGAFVTFFYEQLNAAYKTNDIADLRALTTGTCTTCNNYVAALEQAARDGTTIRGDSFVLTAAVARELQALGTLVEVSVASSSREVVDKSGIAVKELPAVKAEPLQVAVKWIDGRWLVSGIRKTPVG